MTITDNETEHRTITRLMQLYREARDAKRQLYTAWYRNYRLVQNRVSGVGGMSNWQPSPRIPEIQPVISSLVGWMTDQDTTIEIISASDPAGPMFDYQNQLADDLSQIIYSTWKAENYDAQIKLVLLDALMYSVGIGKAVWDAQLEHGYGNASLRRVDPWTFYPDPQATSMDDAEYFIEVRRYSYNEIVRRWPHAETWIESGEGSDPIDERPTLTNERTPAKTNPGNIPQSGGWPGGSSSPGTWSSGSSQRRQEEPDPGYVVYEFWIKENDIWYDDQQDLPEHLRDENTIKRVDVRWRCVIICNNNVLLDEYADEMWGHREHPFERYTFEDLGEFYGVSMVEYLSNPQIYINRLLTAAQHNTELTGNPVWLEAANSGLNRVGVINRPGQRLTVSGAAAMQNKPDWLTPPAMPRMLMDLVKLYLDRMEHISGLSATQKGKVPQQRSAEGTVNAAQEAAMVRVRSALANLEVFLRRIGFKIGDLIVEFYNEPRIMAIIGQDGAQRARQIHGDHFMVPGQSGTAPLKFAMLVNAGSAGPTSRAARIQEADRLFAMGAVDDKYVLDIRQVRNPDDVLKRLYEKRQQGLIGTPGQGSQRQRSGRAS